MNLPMSEPNTLNIAYASEEIAVTEIDAPVWETADSVLIDRYWSGSLAPPGRHCTVKLLWSAAALYVRFAAVQSEPLIVSESPDLKQKTMALWERDVCEIFIAPDKGNARRYLEFEVAPTGEWLDLIVDWRNSEPRDWELRSGMETTARIEPDRVKMAIKIPFEAFGRVPKAGEVWLGNIFRQVGSGETRGYLTWSPTLTPEPQFHVPERFGEFRFVT